MKRNIQNIVIWWCNIYWYGYLQVGHQYDFCCKLSTSRIFSGACSSFHLFLIWSSKLIICCHWLYHTESSWGVWTIHRGWCPLWWILSVHGKGWYMGRTYGVASSISCYGSEYLHPSSKFFFLICFCQMYVSEILLNNIWIQLLIWFKC